MTNCHPPYRLPRHSDTYLYIGHSPTVRASLAVGLSSRGETPYGYLLEVELNAEEEISRREG